VLMPVFQKKCRLLGRLEPGVRASVSFQVVTLTTGGMSFVGGKLFGRGTVPVGGGGLCPRGKHSWGNVLYTRPQVCAS